jgi:hypothetical protein
MADVIKGATGVDAMSLDFKCISYSTEVVCCVPWLLTYWSAELNLQTDGR